MFKWSVCPLLFCVAVANAGVIYSTFGPGDTFLDGHFLIGDGEEIAAAFAPGISANLDTIRIATRYVSGPNNFTVYIAPDIAGAPGAALESFTGLSPTNTPPPPEDIFATPAVILTLNSVSHPLLLAAHGYWVVMSAPDVSTRGGWNLNNQGFAGLLVSADFTGFVWAPGAALTPAFDVSVTESVPEQSTFGLVLAGLAAAVVVAGRRRCVKC